MYPPKLISHYFFLLVTSFGMLNSKKWVGVGVGRLLKRAVQKDIHFGKFTFKVLCRPSDQEICEILLIERSEE